MEIRYIDPCRDLGPGLLGVEKPGRYTGGEYGRLAKREAAFKMLIAFPDLYEIGMSNQALRILYNGLNRIQGISCDRAFAPAPDFEALLRKRGIPLYGLDTGIPLGCLDALCFTLGYELGITGILTILDTAGIPLRKEERSENTPLVILGGPCVSNPKPYERFIDAFWIGEAEGGFFELAEKMLKLKQGNLKSSPGASVRDALFRTMEAHPSIWVSGKATARRALDTAFAVRDAAPAVFPIPSMKTVQHHGAVEIMRGCPNGCRFCHAGIWYRPMRQKNAATVKAEAEAFIKQGGYREISLSSLSTGDYRSIEALVESLNREYGAEHVSFQLPSLKVSSFSLPLLEKVSAVRKSGLTFAVETPVDAWQLAINKQVSRDNVIAILKEARKNGWRSAKFYFMIGLPPCNTGLPPCNTGLPPCNTSAPSEEQEIVDFILDIARQTGMRFHINVGVFVPKPHTPYQWSPQIDEKTAEKKLGYIRRCFDRTGHKVGVQDPFVSVIEGLISRGDERVGEIIEEAFKKGCRLDAWDDFLKKDIWRSLLEKNNALTEEILGARDSRGSLPWDPIDSGVAKAFFLQEALNSEECKETVPCNAAEYRCVHPCGICPNWGHIAENTVSGFVEHSKGCREEDPETNTRCDTRRDTRRILFSFTKTGRAVWLSHLSVIEVFSMAMLRANIPALFSQGFNPLPRLDFAAPLSVGITADAEIATLDTGRFLDAVIFRERLNRELPEGFLVTQAVNITIPHGAKKHSTAALLWGFAYESAESPSALDYVHAADEKKYRDVRTSAGFSLCDLRRRRVLAHRPDGTGEALSYFTVYTELYTEYPPNQ
ncbi:MAG: TIGR03936 family radical SAM-associated protein [Treponema sp.]|jgi:radical SAM-linked protein|nr:TIGR03936 family radical SAM-associated protein [Treponema sp.]